MKVKITLLTLCILITLLTGCGTNDDDGATPTPTGGAATPTTAASTTAPTPTTTAETTPTGGADVVTTASIVNTEEAFLNAISTKGTWIICLLKDMTLNQDLVLDGEFKNGKQDENGNDLIQRKIALYEQDENRKVTARYTLTAPKLTVNSPEARIQSGTFVGDIYVNAKHFQLVDAKVEGNVYFMTDEAETSFEMDATSSITGKKEKAPQ
ncbi:MAG: hypothetical protein K0S76_982 [Herbinix sp.]|jgi:hypothetical protein|nr:hypothetical protein [Herbinix sp.]